jgi:hypothetical protein
MAKWSALDIVMSINGSMVDSDYVAIIKFCVEQIDSPRNVFKVEAIVKSAADLERQQI